MDKKTFNIEVKKIIGFAGLGMLFNTLHKIELIYQLCKIRFMSEVITQVAARGATAPLRNR